MRVAPISADLLVKLALLGVVVVGGIWAVRRITGAASDVYDDFSSALGQGVDFAWRQATTTFNPASDQNFIYGGLSYIGSAATGDSSWSPGTALYNAINGDEWARAQEQEAWAANDRSEVQRLLARYPSYTVGPGGAAFGIYPRQ